MQRLVFFLTLGWVSPSPALACSCSIPPGVVEATQNAAAVFEGTVSQTKGEAVSFKVHRSWKGVSEKEVSLESAPHRSQCDYEFVPGTRYLVYATQKSPENPVLTVSICSRTKPSKAAQIELKELTKNALVKKENR